MPALQASTGRHFLTIAALVVLGGWVGGASAIDPDQRGKLGAAEPASLLARAAPAQKPEEKKIQMIQKSKERWRETLEWLADQTGLPVIGSQVPEGEFTIISPSGSQRRYSIPEIVDILNGQLLALKQPCILIRGAQEFRLLQLPKSPNVAISATGKEQIIVSALPADQAAIGKFIEAFKDTLEALGEKPATGE